MAKANTPPKPSKAPTPPKEDPSAKDPITEGAKPGDEPPAPGASDPGAPGPGAPDLPPPADPANDKKKAKAAGYVCLEPVKHNGQRHKIDDPIELTEAEAEPLLKLQAIAPA